MGLTQAVLPLVHVVLLLLFLQNLSCHLPEKCHNKCTDWCDHKCEGCPIEGSEWWGGRQWLAELGNSSEVRFMNSAPGDSFRVMYMPQCCAGWGHHLDKSSRGTRRGTFIGHRVLHPLGGLQQTFVTELPQISVMKQQSNYSIASSVYATS